MCDGAVWESIAISVTSSNNETACSDEHVNSPARRKQKENKKTNTKVAHNMTLSESEYQTTKRWSFQEIVGVVGNLSALLGN